MKEGVEDIVLQAWREQWSEVEWSIRIKRFRVMDIVDQKKICCSLLSHATLSEVPNQLLVNYIVYMHAAQLVQDKPVLDALLGFDRFDKILCVRAVMQLLATVAETVRWEPDDETLMLSLVSWLLKGAQRSGQQMRDSFILTLNNLFKSFYFRCCFFLCTYANPDGVIQLKKEVATLHNEGCEGFESLLGIFSNPREQCWFPADPGEAEVAGTDSALLLSFMAVCAISRYPDSLQSVAQTILRIKNFKRFAWSVVYKSLLRGSLMAQLEAPAAQESNCTAFTFLKVPRLLATISEMGGDKSQLHATMRLVATEGSLLDRLDMKNHADTFQCFVNELKKQNLYTEADASQQLLFRSARRQNNPDLGSNSQACINLVLKAEPTFQTLLKSFYSDFSKNHERVVQMMQHMITGKSFEFICAAAAATDKLASFTTKLIEFNEASSNAKDKEDTGLLTSMFDLSFLLLSRIQQMYGTTFLLAQKDTMGTFFYQWCLTLNGADQHSVEMSEDCSEGDVLLEELCSEQWPGRHDLRDACRQIPSLVQLLIRLSQDNDKVKVAIHALSTAASCVALGFAQYLASCPSSENRRHLAGIFLQAVTASTPNMDAKLLLDKHAFMNQIVRRVLAHVANPTPTFTVCGFHWLETACSSEIICLSGETSVRETLVSLFHDAIVGAQGRLTPALVMLLNRQATLDQSSDNLLIVATVWLEEFSKLSSTAELAATQEFLLGVNLLLPDSFSSALVRCVVELLSETETRAVAQPPRGPALATLLVQLVCLQSEVEEQPEADGVESKKRKLSNSTPLTALERSIVALFQLINEANVPDLRVYFSACLLRAMAKFSHVRRVLLIAKEFPEPLIKAVLRADSTLLPFSNLMRLYSLDEVKQRKRAFDHVALLHSLLRL